MPYLIDGNNVIGQSREQNLKNPHARARLVSQIAAFCREHRAEATVVFDGEPDPLIPSRDVHLGPVRVLFAGHGRDADGLILDLLDAMRDPASTIVVTSDRSLSDKARHRRAKTLRSHQLRHRLRPREGAKPEAEDSRLSESEIAEWMDYFSRGGPAAS